jgi:L-alanine-DL-glutamate epimerase-like enolase superfamily enzyme
MLQVRHYSFELAFEYPFTTYKGTKTFQPTLVVSLGIGNMIGYGEAPAISYYDVSVEKMIEALNVKKGVIERYALIDTDRFWHFLHHLLPGQHFLIAALDIAAWDLFAKMRRKPIYELLGQKWENIPPTDYTLGMDSIEEMKSKMDANPWPVYKIKVGSPNDMDKLVALRSLTNAPFRVDANEGWTFDEAKKLLPELELLNISMVEQPLKREETEAMKELKQISKLPFFADESCRTEDEVKKCAEGFHGINIKLTKCGGITPALRMIKEARTLGLKVMIGSMNESTVGTAAIANLMPLIDEVDADGPLLLKEDIAEGVKYDKGIISLNGDSGLGIQFWGEKREK